MEHRTESENYLELAPLEQFFRLYLMKLPPIFIGMQMRGVRVDPWRRAEMREEYVREQAEAIERLEAAAGMKIMAKKSISNKALLELLYTRMRLPKQYNRKTGSLTADKKALDKLATKVNDEQRPLFQDILTIRELGVEISTFLDADLDSDGRLRWSTNLAGTVSGRISTSASPFWTGTNIQNWNEDVRDIVVSEPDDIFVYADGEQAEARAVAFLAEDAGLQEVFSSGLNVHAQMANRLFGYPLARTEAELEALKKTAFYADAKRTVHAANYDMSFRMAAITMKCSEAAAMAKLEAYHSSFPGVRGKFHADVRRLVQTTRMLETPFFRRRQFFGRMDDELIRGAISYVPQSVVADWMDAAILRAKYFSEGNFNPYPGSILENFFKLSEPKFAPSFSALQIPFRPSVQIHDGLLCQSKLQDLPATIDLLREAMTYEIPFPSGKLTIPVDVKIGFRWKRLVPANAENVRKAMNSDPMRRYSTNKDDQWWKETA